MQQLSYLQSFQNYLPRDTIKAETFHQQHNQTEQQLIEEQINEEEAKNIIEEIRNKYQNQDKAEAIIYKAALLLGFNITVPKRQEQRKPNPPRLRKPFDPNMMSREDKERILANVFMHRGYGMTIAKEEVNFDMDLNFYYISIKNIVFNAFRKLQSVINNDCKQPLKLSEDQKSVRFKTELSRCDQWMTSQEKYIFFEFIKSVYNLNPGSVSKGLTIRLYEKIVQHCELTHRTQNLPNHNKHKRNEQRSYMCEDPTIVRPKRGRPRKIRNEDFHKPGNPTQKVQISIDELSTIVRNQVNRVFQSEKN